MRLTEAEHGIEHGVAGFGAMTDPLPLFSMSPISGAHPAGMTFEDHAFALAESGRYSTAKSVLSALYRLGYADAYHRASWSLRRRIRRACREKISKIG